MTFATYQDQVVQHAGENSILYFEATEDILQGQLVELDTDNSGRTVEPSDADGGQAIGFAEYGVSSGDMVSVATAGAVVRATAGASISSSDPVSAEGATGEEGEIQTATSGDWIIGTALQDSTGSDGDAGNCLVLVSNPNPYGNP